MVSYSDIATPNQDYQFSASEMDLLNKLAAINDSIASSNVESEDLTRVSVNWGQVIKADARGLKEGFKYGWSKGGSLRGRFSTALLTAGIYAIAYSVHDFVRQVLFHGAPSADAANRYSMYDVQLALAVSLDSDELNNRVNQIKLENPEFGKNTTDDDLKLAMAHNIALEELESGTLLPSGILNNVFSDEQLNFFNSTGNTSYYNNVPNIVSGRMSFRSILRVDPLPLATEIIDLYFEGIDQIQANDVDDYEEALRALCINYITTVTESDIDEDSKSNAIPAIYMCPISFMHWKPNF